MPSITTDDGVDLYYEEAGSGPALLFVHEFAGDFRAWEPQMRHFSRHYRCIAYNARGFPPSAVPDDVGHYSQDRARDDIRAVLDSLEIEHAHVIGLSMGGFATLHFGIHYPQRALSLVIAGCGYGAEPDKREQFAAEANAAADAFENTNMAQAALDYGSGPTRVQFQNRDRRGWQEFVDQLSEHSSRGCAMTLRGVQASRPSLYELRAQIAAVELPTLIMTGDEDWPCLEPALMLKREMRRAGLVVMPNAGHAINLEDPAAFNRHLEEFLSAVTLQSWPTRDPRAMKTAILGAAESDS